MVVVLVGTVAVVVGIDWLIVIDEHVVPMVEGPIRELACLEGCSDAM